MSADPPILTGDTSDIACGEDASKHFMHDPDYINLNHGSYGTYPREVRRVYTHYQERIEARPDAFVRYEYRPVLLPQAREAIAAYLDVPTECCVFIPNASTGIDTVLHNLDYKPSDVIIGFPQMYESNKWTAQYLVEMTPVEFRQIEYVYPASDQTICDALENALKELLAAGKTPRVAIFDTVSSLPALRMPFERLTELCRSYQVLSLIDGAHSVGMLPLQLRQLDADFFVSNCHKWLYTPRGCAVLYVPSRRHHLLKVTFPTGFGFVPFPRDEDARKDVSNNFVANFADLGTRDDTPYLCVQAALEWRKRLVWGEKRGEEAIMSYMYHLAETGGSIAAEILGTEVLARGQCSMTNVRLPLSVDSQAGDPSSSALASATWIRREMMTRHNTAVNITWYNGSLWVRLSAQVYLTLQDFRTAATNLKTLCDEVSRKPVV